MGSRGVVGWDERSAELRGGLVLLVLVGGFCGGGGGEDGGGKRGRVAGV